MEKIKIGILGYGNLGRGAAYAVRQNSDMELVGIFTRRNPKTLVSPFHDINIYAASELDDSLDIDVLLLCGGSATDLPEQSPYYAQRYNIVDSFDNHSRIPEHFCKVDRAAKRGGRLALISTGWDPGLFSLQRAIGKAVLPKGTTDTFWGKGVSQGHSDAIRRIKGVRDARQYTIPVDTALEAVRSGEKRELTPREKHIRECFVEAEEGANLAEIERQIVTMPAYFADYDTIVHFVDRGELEENHREMPHGGFVIRTGKTGAVENRNQLFEFRLKLASNPEFTAGVLACYARAVYRLARQGECGCKTVLDIAPGLLLPEEEKEQRSALL